MAVDASIAKLKDVLGDYFQYEEVVAKELEQHFKRAMMRDV